MNKQIFINVPVADLARSKAFFAALGFSCNPRFTDDTAACVVISETISVMLLTHDKFYQFTPRVCLGKLSAQRERERVLGQGDRSGGGPADRAAEGNTGPAPFLASLVEPLAMGRELNQTHPSHLRYVAGG